MLVSAIVGVAIYLTKAKVAAATAAVTGGGVGGGMGGQSASNTALNMIDPPFKVWLWFISLYNFNISLYTNWI